MKERPKVLLFIDWYLPGYKAGGPIQSCVNLVSHLKPHFDFYVITRDTDYTATVPYDNIIPDNWNEVGGAQVYYLSGSSLKSRNLRRLLNEVAPDIMYVNGIYSYYFSILPVIISRQLGHKKIIVAARGMLAQSAIQVKGIKKRLFIKLSKVYNLYQGVRFHATNIEEEAAIREVLGRHVQVKIAPNLPEALDAFDDAAPPRVKIAGELDLVSIARIAPEKNTLYALEVLCSYKGEGRIRFDLYGPVYDRAYWEKCKAVIAQLPSNISVNYKGSLEKQDVSGTLGSYHALFMPTKGENFGHVILESLLAGCVVLVSDQTPWKGLAASKIGYDLMLADISAYHAAIDELLQLDQEEFNLLSQNARNYAVTYCQDKAHLEANKQLFRFD